MQVLTANKNMHFILNSSTGTLVTVAISATPDGGFRCKGMCSQAKPAHIPHNMLREVKVQIARWHQGGLLQHKLPLYHESRSIRNLNSHRSIFSLS